MGTSYKRVGVAISGKEKSEQGPKKVREGVMQISGEEMPERESSKREGREGRVYYACLEEEQDGPGCARERTEVGVKGCGRDHLGPGRPL